MAYCCCFFPPWCSYAGYLASLPLEEEAPPLAARSFSVLSDHLLPRDPNECGCQLAKVYAKQLEACARAAKVIIMLYNVKAIIGHNNSTFDQMLKADKLVQR